MEPFSVLQEDMVSIIDANKLSVCLLGNVVPEVKFTTTSKVKCRLSQTKLKISSRDNFTIFALNVKCFKHYEKEKNWAIDSPIVSFIKYYWKVNYKALVHDSLTCNGKRKYRESNLSKDIQNFTLRNVLSGLRPHNIRRIWKCLR